MPRLWRRCSKRAPDPNARDKYGWTPLHRAVEYGKAEAVAALLDAGADGGARNKAGHFPADLAKENEKLGKSPVYWRLHDARWR
ncbi:MAG: ankyrin repeat domain-containing protein [Rhodospirillales bacterium]|nr:ankyrin repeat domain-containing protein [Rhodospirillales bacterium]